MCQEIKDKIRVGEWIRTKKGVIAKCEYFDKKSNSYWFDKVIERNYEETLDFINKNKVNKYIKKHSKNKIELLECEDIVTLEYYVSKFRKRIKRRFEVFRAGNLMSFSNIYCDFLYDLNKNKFLDGKGFNPKIKEIVTHEEFESIKYNFEEEE